MSRLFLSPHKTSCSLWWSSLYFLFVHFWTFCRVGQNLRFTFFPTFWHIIDKMIHQLIDKIIFRLTNNEANWLLQHLICIQLNSQEHLFRNNCCTTTLLVKPATAMEAACQLICPEAAKCGDCHCFVFCVQRSDKMSTWTRTASAITRYCSNECNQQVQGKLTRHSVDVKSRVHKS